MGQSSAGGKEVKRASRRMHVWLGLAVAGIGAVLLLVWFRAPVLAFLGAAYHLLTEREQTAKFIASFGAMAPLIFMAIQVLQVIVAPIPGEATGFLGGYLFGALAGTLYSSLALTLGSWINFAIGRFLGTRWVRRLVPVERLARFDYLLRHQGALVVFVLFLIPGFPKDYLCLFLGLSSMPMRVFLMMALVGRVPGTLMLSLQGALVYEKNYFVFIVVMAVNALAVYIGYRHRIALYRWIEKLNGPADERD